MEKIKLTHEISHSISLENRLLIIKLGLAICGTLILILLITLIFGPMHSHASTHEALNQFSVASFTAYLDINFIKTSCI